MLILQTILSLFLYIVSQASAALSLQADLQKDYKKLQEHKSYFISDNTTDSPSLETIANDLQLFMVAASIDLSNSTHSSSTKGKHVVNKWQFTTGNIQAIYQIDSAIALDTVVTQRYLENKPATQHRITNNFSFRIYAVSTTDTPLKFFYLTEAEQGLLGYKIKDRHVQVNYSGKKNGLNDILPKYEEEVNKLLTSLLQQ